MTITDKFRNANIFAPSIICGIWLNAIELLNYFSVHDLNALHVTAATFFSIYNFQVHFFAHVRPLIFMTCVITHTKKQQRNFRYCTYLRTYIDEREIKPQPSMKFKSCTFPLIHNGKNVFFLSFGHHRSLIC